MNYFLLKLHDLYGRSEIIRFYWRTAKIFRPGYLYFLWQRYRNPQIFSSDAIEIAGGFNYSSHVINWILAKGDNTLRLDYPLNENSLVIDVGGYIGDFANKIRRKYNCYVIIFEVNPNSFKALQGRFLSDKKVRLFSFGLSNKNMKAILSDSGIGSSIYQRSPEGFNVKLRDIALVLDELNIKEINLIKINIEGGEYNLLRRMIETGIINKCMDIQIQFHRFYPNARRARREIIKRLSKTHYLTYIYPFVWENWRRFPL